MKKSVLTLVTALVLALIIVNQTNKSETVAFLEERVISSEEKAWQQVPLEGLFQANAYYQFDSEELQLLLNDSSADKLRFYLGVENDQLQVSSGTVVAGVESAALIQSQLVSTNPIDWGGLEASSAADGLSQEVNQHLLDAHQAGTYVQNWTDAIHQSNGIEDLVAYQGTRIKHFTISKAAMAHLMNQEEVQDLALFWGLNQNLKLTTVFLGVDQNGSILLPNDKNLALDFTLPCPIFCDPKGNGIQYAMTIP